MLIWPSDSVSQCHVESSQTDDDEYYEDDVSGDSVAEEMSRLDITSKEKASSALALQSFLSTTASSSSSSSSPSPSNTSKLPSMKTQPQCGPLPGLDEMLCNVEDRSYKTLDSRERAPLWGLGANAADPYHKTCTMVSGGRTKASWHRVGSDNVDISPELVHSIFGGISRMARGRRFALLMMDDESGRWRVIRSQRPAKTFPTNER